MLEHWSHAIECSIPRNKALEFCSTWCHYQEWLAANPLEHAWGDASLPQHLSPLHHPSALQGNRDRADPRDPQQTGQTGATPPTEARAGNLGGKRKMWFELWRGALRALCFTVPHQGQDSLHSAVVTHKLVMGSIWNGTGKSSEHPKAPPGLVHLGPGSVLRTGEHRGYLGLAGSWHTPFILEGVTLTCRTAQEKKLQNLKNNSIHFFDFVCA